MRKNVIADSIDVAGTATVKTLTVSEAVTVPASSLLTSSSAFVTNETNNRVVTSLGANAGLNGEANLTFDGSTLAVTGSLTVAAAGALTHTNYRLSGSKALTGGSATTFVSVAAASNGYCGGNIEYTIIANDSTDYQVRSGIAFFAMANKGGTCTIHVTDNLIGADAQSAATTGITATFTGAEDVANTLAIKCTAASDLTETTLTIYYTVNCQYPNTITAA